MARTSPYSSTIELYGIPPRPMVERVWSVRTTGEYRLARAGEWFVDPLDKEPRKSVHGTIGLVWIVEVKEQ